MNLTVNGSKPKVVTFNGNDVKVVKCNGVEVWRKVTARTATWKHAALGSRPWKSPYDIDLTVGTNLGTKQGTKFTYEVQFPVYHSSSNSNSYAVYCQVGATSGATTIQLPNQNFTTSGTYKQSIQSTTWLGDKGTLWLRIHMGNGSYLSVNSGAEFSLKITDPGA